MPSFRRAYEYLKTKKALAFREPLNTLNKEFIRNYI